MFTFTVKMVDGFTGGTAEVFNTVETDGKQMLRVYTGKGMLSFVTGAWVFRAGGQIVFSIDLDDENKDR